MVTVIDNTKGYLYVNGALAGSCNITGQDGVSVVTLGTRHTFTAPLNAAMNDLRVYATALTAEDIKALYQTRMSATNTGAILTF